MAVDWFELLPTRVAKAQARWERGRRALRAHEAGATLATIGESLGVSRQRVSQICTKARLWDGPSPAEQYLADARTAEELGPFVKRERLRRERERVRPPWSGGLSPAEFRARLEDAKRLKELRLAEGMVWWRRWEARQAAQAARRAQRALVVQHTA